MPSRFQYLQPKSIIICLQKNSENGSSSRTYSADGENVVCGGVYRDADGGRFIPAHCRGKNNTNCGEILISNGYQNLPHLSILVEIVTNLKLPLGLTYVSQATFETALKNKEYVILYLTPQDILVTNHINRFKLPVFQDGCMLANQTNYVYK